MIRATKIPHSSTLPKPPPAPKPKPKTSREQQRDRYERLTRIPASVSESMLKLYLDTPVKLSENDVEETPRQIMAWARGKLAEMDREDGERAAKKAAKRAAQASERAAAKAEKEPAP